MISAVLSQNFAGLFFISDVSNVQFTVVLFSAQWLTKLGYKQACSESEALEISTIEGSSIISRPSRIITVGAAHHSDWMLFIAVSMGGCEEVGEGGGTGRREAGGRGKGKDVNLISSTGNSRTVAYCSESYFNFSDNGHYALQLK